QAVLICMLALLVDELLLFFFFQAEDGIRDRTVTGVQTCALPISPSAAPSRRSRRRFRRFCRSSPPAGSDISVPPTRPDAPAPARSEERRVGKECRSRRWLCG